MELRFRKITDDDLKMIMAWRSMPEVTLFMYTDIEPDIEKQRAWFRALSADSRRLDWIIVADGDDVGLVSIVNIDPVNRRCEWAYYLASESVRGKGIGKSVEMSVLEYVFETLGLNKLCCEVFCSNQKVIQIHERFGSKVEGTRRQHIHKNGEFLDIVEMGILKSEWEQNVRGQFKHTPAVIQPLNKEALSVQPNL